MTNLPTRRAASSVVLPIPGFGQPLGRSRIPVECLGRAGAVEWWKHQADMPGRYARSSIVCLPSYYGEGIPRSLIEATACGRAAIATDVPGCREVVRHGENGLLVSPRNPEALAEAIATLLEDPALRARMGARGREIAVQEISDERVVRETLALYRELLGAKWPAAASVPVS